MEQKNELLSIFSSEEDERGIDLLKMSDFMDVFTKKIKLDSEHTWKQVENIEKFAVEWSSVFKTGFDLSNMGMLVADHSHFSKDIVDGLKSGLYHVGESKEVSGNMRPVIVDGQGHIVKHFTLKKAIDPSEVLSDVTALSIQSSLQEISSQISEIKNSLDYEIAFERQNEFDVKFLNAREMIKKAANASDASEEYRLLEKSDEYLIEGLNTLYLDIKTNIENLAEKKLKLNEIDRLLVYIDKDMQMIPKFVGIRVHLLNYQKKYEDVKRVLIEYKHQLFKLTESNRICGKYSYFELVHKYYPYDKNNVDFWMESPKQMIDAIVKYEYVLNGDCKNVYFIEDEEGEKVG